VWCVGIIHTIETGKDSPQLICIDTIVCLVAVGVGLCVHMDAVQVEKHLFHTMDGGG
jgi:hypothetical protein